MSKESKNQNSLILTDRFGRKHSYLRMSITSNCNLKCVYCMPENTKVKPDIMSAKQIYSIAKYFVQHGVTKIRITGGEPLIRKDIISILELLSQLNVELAITTNGVLADRFIDVFRRTGIKKINFSLDSLKEEKNLSITKRKYLEKVMNNIDLFVSKGFETKVNCVLMKGINDDEIIDFVNETKDKNVNIRFIEFMPFDGNKWNLSKIVGHKEILDKLYKSYGHENVIKIEDKPNDTSKSYQISTFKGVFSIISTVTNPFCDTCNRIRVTADGYIKNCLFSTSELNILELIRNGENIDSTVIKAIKSKALVRSGLALQSDFINKCNHKENRSMVSIGG